MSPFSSSSLRGALTARLAWLSTGTALLLGGGFVLFGLAPAREQIAASQFREAAVAVTARLDEVFRPAERVLAMSQGWIGGEAPSLNSPEDFNRVFQPMLEALPQATSVVAGTNTGQGWLLLQRPDGTWRNRMTDLPRLGDRHLLIDRWPDGRERREWKALGYDPRERPWYKAASGAPEGAVRWTAPYVFFTTHDPGISASARGFLADGRELRLGLDLMLRDLSQATMHARVGRRGLALVLTDDERVLALPAPRAGHGETDWLRLALEPAPGLGLAPVNAALEHWRASGRQDREVFCYATGREEWMASLRPYDLGEQRLWVLVLAPEADFDPDWGPLLWALGGGMILVLTLALLLARSQALRIAAPLEAAALASERIGRLEFERPPARPSGMTEIDRLVQAQDAMRELLRQHQETLAARETDLREQLQALRQAKARLKESDAYNQVLFADSGIALLVLDPADTRVLDCNHAALRILQLERREDLLGRPFAELAPPIQEGGEWSRESVWGHFRRALDLDSHVFEWRLSVLSGAGAASGPPPEGAGANLGRPGQRLEATASGGGVREVEVRFMAFRHGGRTLVQCSLQDISERKAAKAQLEHLAFHDALTGLPNRVLLLNQLRQELAEARRAGRTVCLLLLDLDRFKEINDTQGHGEGDSALVEVARRFQSALGAEESIARLGGDEFIVLAPGSGQEHALVLAERLAESLSPPLVVKGQTFTLGVSIGICLGPEDGATPELLLRHADIAMYRAKHEGGGIRFYRAEMSASLAERVLLARDLRAAMEHGGELLLHYQPQVALDSTALSGAEALLRWRRPGGMVEPARFIPLAEERGMMPELGDWVLASAAAQMAAWDASATPLPGRLAINLSVRQLKQADFPARAEGIVRRHGLAPERFELELTESGYMRQVETSLDNLNRLKAAGFALAIDDFGAGYSSLAYLKRLPAGRLKIDMSFVRDMLEDGNDAAIVTTILAMGRTLQLTTIAEGVETAEQAAALREMGCDEAQGFLFGRPLPAEDFARRWLPG